MPPLSSSVHCSSSNDISALGQSVFQDVHLVRDKAGVRTSMEKMNPAFGNFLLSWARESGRTSGEVAGVSFRCANGGRNEKVGCVGQLWGRYSLAG